MPGQNTTINRTHWTYTATISASGTTSGSIDLRNAAFGGVQLPSSMTGTTMTYTVSGDNSTFVALTDSAGNSISQTIAASKGFALPAEAFAFPFLKLVSGSSEASARSLLVTLGA